ncbi:hypothetical protein DSBG_0358 [Desulfosporosinus sp. BG]|nr:hypothetical protein DSBG_0358 [Desulfosporosinus sp. BG]
MSIVDIQLAERKHEQAIFECVSMSGTPIRRRLQTSVFCKTFITQMFFRAWSKVGDN